MKLCSCSTRSLPFFEVAQRIRGTVRAWPPSLTTQADGDGVDGEVPALQVLLLGAPARTSGICPWLRNMTRHAG